MSLKMFENLRNFATMMNSMKELKPKMESLQADLARMTVEGDAGAGAVRVTANGKMEILSVRLDRAMLASFTGSGSDADQRLVEELIATAVNAAIARAQELIQRESAKLMQGVNLPPGLDKMINS